MKTPYFSIVIPTKGRSFLVGGAIESALRQTFTDLEVIVADNDEGNATRDVVAKFKDPRLRYHRTGNLSMPDNWETACAQARGEYLLLLEDKQALKFRALERIHGETEKSRPECLRWMMDWMDDIGPTKFIIQHKGTGIAQRLDPEAILKSFVQIGLSSVSKTLPIGHYSGLSRTLLNRIKAGPMQRLVPPVCPDYMLAFLALAYTDSVVAFDEALGASSQKHSNGRSFVLKTGNLRGQFLSELGGRDSIFFDLVPVKAPIVPGVIYNDYLHVREKVGGRLDKFPLHWPAYFVETYQFIVGCHENGVNMDDERAAWQVAFDQQPAGVREATQDLLAESKPQWRKQLHSLFKGVRRKTGLLKLESNLKMQFRRVTGRKMAGRFQSVLEYVEWEHTHQTAAKD